MTVPQSSQPQSPPRQRPRMLRGMLLLWMIGSAVSIWAFLSDLMGKGTAYTPFRHPQWAIVPIGILSIVNLVCVIAIWNWKRWGLYGLALSATAMFLITAISLGWLEAVLTLVGTGLIWLFARPVWKQMT